jgi:hypothetical protein
VDLGRFELPTSWLQTSNSILQNLARTSANPGESGGYGRSLFPAFAANCTTSGAVCCVFVEWVGLDVSTWFGNIMKQSPTHSAGSPLYAPKIVHGSGEFLRGAGINLILHNHEHRTFFRLWL